jgi:hypothetical protein
LRDALDTLAAAPPLPSPLPPEPPAPISYLHNVISSLNAPALGPGDQYGLWQQLQAALDEAEDDERAELLKLVRRLRRRRDLMPQLGASIDAAIGPVPPPGEQSWPPVPASTWTAPTQIRPLPTTYVAPPPSPPSRRIAWIWAAMAAVAVALIVWIAVTLANFGGSGGGSGQRTTTTAAATTMTTSEAPGPANGNPGPGHTIDTEPTEQETFEMPDLSGLTVDGATEQLLSRGWSGSVNPSGQEGGTIVGQDPLAGNQVPFDVTVTLTLTDITVELSTTTTMPPEPG